MSRSTRRRVASRRGRPPIHREKEDKGTHELQLKRAAGITQEPVDRWLKQGRLSADMHHCALHFRWLYTLRFGSPSIKALNPAEYLGCEHRPVRPAGVRRGRRNIASPQPRLNRHIAWKQCWKWQCSTDHPL